MENPLGRKTIDHDSTPNTSSSCQMSVDYASILPILLFCFWNLIWLACLGLAIFTFQVNKITTASCGFMILLGIFYFNRVIATKSQDHSD